MARDTLDVVLDELAALDKQAPPAQNGNGRHERDDSKPLRADWHAVFRPVPDILDEPDQDVPWLVRGLIPKGWAGMVAGDGRVGKTLLMLDLAHAVATGGLF